MYKKVADAQYRSKLSNELMMYHMKVGVALKYMSGYKIIDFQSRTWKITPINFEFQYTGVVSEHRNICKHTISTLCATLCQLLTRHMNIQDQMLSTLHHLYISTHMYVPQYYKGFLQITHSITLFHYVLANILVLVIIVLSFFKEDTWIFCSSLAKTTLWLRCTLLLGMRQQFGFPQG